MGKVAAPNWLIGHLSLPIMSSILSTGLEISMQMLLVCLIAIIPSANALPILLSIQMPPGNDVSMILLDVLEANTLAPDQEKNLIFACQGPRETLLDIVPSFTCHATLPAGARTLQCVINEMLDTILPACPCLNFWRLTSSTLTLGNILPVELLGK